MVDFIVGTLFSTDDGAQSEKPFEEITAEQESCAQKAISLLDNFGAF